MAASTVLSQGFISLKYSDTNLNTCNLKSSSGTPQFNVRTGSIPPFGVNLDHCLGYAVLLATLHHHILLAKRQLREGVTHILMVSA